MNEIIGKKVIVGVVLAALGFVGNTLAVPVSFDVMFIFGSIFSVIAVSRLGIGAGTAVAVIASSYTPHFAPILPFW